MADEADAGGPEVAARFYRARDFLAEGLRERAVDAGEVDAHFFEDFAADEGGDAAALEHFPRLFLPWGDGELGRGLVGLEGLYDIVLQTAEVSFRTGLQGFLDNCGVLGHGRVLAYSGTL